MKRTYVLVTLTSSTLLSQSIVNDFLEGVAVEELWFKADDQHAQT